MSSSFGVLILNVIYHIGNQLFREIYPSFDSTQPFRINKQQGIVETVGVEIWISPQVPACGGIVVAVEIVVKTCLLVIVLTRKSQVVGDSFG